MKPSYILVHHSLTSDSETVSWGAIRRYHHQLGWSDIGYHAGVELVRDHYEILLGRMWDQSGAHCTQEGMNYKSLGLCLVGNFDEIEPPHEMFLLAQRLCRYWMRLFQIPSASVFPHRRFAPYKSCPGELFPWEEFVKGL